MQDENSIEGWRPSGLFSASLSPDPDALDNVVRVRCQPQMVNCAKRLDNLVVILVARTEPEWLDSPSLRVLNGMISAA